MKIAIVTDSTSYLPEEYLKQHNIIRVPLNIILGEESFMEVVELDTATFYDKVRTDEVFPKTSQPAIGKIVELFETLTREYDAVLTFTLSSEISGTYQSACSAARMVDPERIFVFDSEISCSPMGFFVQEAVRMRDQGRTVAEILPALEAMRSEIRAYFIVDDLDHLQRGGRLSSAQALVGGFLQVKPILHFQDKKIVPFEKIRTRKKAIKRVLELMAVDSDKKLEVVVINGDCPEDGADLAKLIQKEFKVEKISESFFGPVIGTHLGAGALGVTWRILD